MPAVNGPLGAPPSAAPTLVARAVDAAIVSSAAIAAAWYFTIVEWRTTFWGFPLDDAWIHLQFARNLGTGHGFSYNPGIPVAGSTAPLWTAVLALPAALHLEPVASSKIVGLALTIVAALLTGEI